MSGPIVSSNWLHAHLTDPNLVILDASPKENKAGIASALSGQYIKNSRLLDINSFSDSSSHLPSMLPHPEVFQKASRNLGINNNSTIVIYDNLGVYMSPRVWWMFKAMGHENIYILDGGLPDWVAQGFEVKTSLKSNFEHGNFTARYNPGLVAGLSTVVDNLQSKQSILIDARSEGRFNGTAPEPRKGLRSGHIPYSVNIPFELVLVNGKYKSKDELQRIFDGFQLENKPLIFSCGSGVTACIVLLAAELVIKNHKSVFDGSWTQWALSEHLPVECMK